MIRKSFFIFMITIAVAGCKRTGHVLEPVPANPVLDDARTILLKNVEADHLPSPYFHFEYDSLHYVKKISFASDFFVYNVEYENKRVKKLINIINGTALNYSYTNERVSEINEVSGVTGKMTFTYQLSYNSNNQVTQAFWYRYNGNGEKILVKRADLVYQPDGNLASIDWFSNQTTEPLTWSSREEFSDYDDKANSTDIAFLKDFYFFDSYLFLPHVIFQKNNPKKEHITSTESEFFISNSYDYQNDLPIAKYSLVNQTKGTNPAPLTQVATRYSYY